MPRVRQIDWQQAETQEAEKDAQAEPVEEARNEEAAPQESEVPKQEIRENAVEKAVTYEVKLQKMAIRDAPNITSSNVILVLKQGERICGVPQEVDGLPWLRLSRESMKSHPQASVLEKECAWALIDASETDLGLGQLLERAPAELSWCASPGETRSTVWEVVGRGGVVVTRQQDPHSSKEMVRLEPGSLIKETACDAQEGRIKFVLLAGQGPEKGWVTTDRLQRVAAHRAASTTAEQPWLDKPDGQKVERAMRWYCDAFGHKPEANNACPLKKANFKWRADRAESRSQPTSEVLEQELRAAMQAAAPEVVAALEPAAAAEAGCANEAPKTSKETDKFVCHMCRLPIGDWCYRTKGREVHAECYAQILVQEAKEEEEERERDEQLKRKLRHEEFDIGWNPSKIPLNSLALTKLQGEKQRHGLLALALTPEGGVTLVPTACPGAAVNLEYLSVALKVRLEEGKEPTFSLDPVNPEMKDTMQIKRFEPAWLKSTKVGDILFESDFHLKELSLGEYEQPVVGMKSCFDYSDEGKFDEEWAAREWFVVRKAEVQMSEDGVLIPWCKMGVEAREQVLADNGFMEDRKVTRQDHPLVRYAEDFTQNFDLIAERKSVIFHLRELAKASILAKYLDQSDLDVEDFWQQLYHEEEEPCILEIPQVWNERIQTQIRVANGKILQDNADKNSRCVYGGVQFGLNRLRVAPMAAGGLGASGAIQARRGFIPPRMGFQPSRSFAGMRGFQVPSGALTARRGFVAPSSSLSARRSFIAPSGVMTARKSFVAPGAAISARPGFPLTPSRLSMPTMTATMPLRGVDLNLDSFNLTETPVSAREGPIALSENLDDLTAVGSAFWPQIEKAESSSLGKEERGFLNEVFNPCLSDRRSEGELFVPPDTIAAYGDALKGLLRKEREVRRQRKEHFLSASFIAGDAGPLFPFSWTSKVELARGRSTPKAAPPKVALEPRPGFKAEALQLKTSLESSRPVFEKCTEDGICFRIYRIGSLEVRTTQDLDAEEQVGAVFSMGTAVEETRPEVDSDERIDRATLFVEGSSAEDSRYFVVLETKRGGIIVTEKLVDGTTTWEMNPVGLNDRSSLAKVICHAEGLASLGDTPTIHSVKIYQGARFSSDVTVEARQRYAEGAFSRVSRRSRALTLSEPFEAFAAKHYPKLHAMMAFSKKEKPPLVA